MNNAFSLSDYNKIKFPSFKSDVKWVKTLFYNFRFCNSSCPVRIYPKVHMYISPSAKIVHKNGMLRLGRRWSVERFRHSELIMRDNAVLEINNYFEIYTGSRIVISPGAKLILGKGGMNYNVYISAVKSITIGDNVYLSENVIVMDSDHHAILSSSGNFTAPITIGNNVLIGINSTILKGVTIGDGAVVAANSLVNKSVPAKVLVGGVPAKVIRENVNWKL